MAHRQHQQPTAGPGSKRDGPDHHRSRRPGVAPDTTWSLSVLLQARPVQRPHKCLQALLNVYSTNAIKARLWQVALAATHSTGNLVADAQHAYVYMRSSPTRCQLTPPTACATSTPWDELIRPVSPGHSPSFLAAIPSPAAAPLPQNNVAVPQQISYNLQLITITSVGACCCVCCVCRRGGSSQ